MYKNFLSSNNIVEKSRKEIAMAKNKNNNYKNSTSNSSKDTASNTSNNKSGGSMKDTNTQMPDNRPARSGPGGA